MSNIFPGFLKSLSTIFLTQKFQWGIFPPKSRRPDFHPILFRPFSPQIDATLCQFIGPVLPASAVRAMSDIHCWVAHHSPRPVPRPPFRTTVAVRAHGSPNLRYLLYRRLFSRPPKRRLENCAISHQAPLKGRGGNVCVSHNTAYYRLISQNRILPPFLSYFLMTSLPTYYLL